MRNLTSKQCYLLTDFSSYSSRWLTSAICVWPILPTILAAMIYIHWYFRLPNSISFNDCWQRISTIILYDFTHQQQHDKRKCDLLSEPFQKGHPSYSFKWQISSFSVINVKYVYRDEYINPQAPYSQRIQFGWMNAWIMWHVIQYTR